MEPNSANRALGYGLLAGAGGLALLGLLWLLVGGVQAGGFVLGLMLLLVLVGPLAGAGWFLLSRQRVEALEEAAFAGKRRILEADRVFRRELAAELRQLARRPGLPAGRLEDMAEDLERKAYDTPEWYDIVHLENADATTLRQYDDLVWERVRWLRGYTEQADAAGTAAAVQKLEEALDQRRDLLMRRKRAPVAAPSALLRAGAPARGVEALLNLRVDDAVSYEGEDYIAEGVATYFAEGQNWKLVHLMPSGPGAGERWLYVAPGGLAAALLDELPSIQPGEETAIVGGTGLPLADRGTATVDLVSKAGSARGVLVSFWSYRAGDRLAFIERWPDGAVHAYCGQLVRATDLEVWPSAIQDAGTR